MYELIGPKTYFVYDREIEYLYAAIGLLLPNGGNENVKKVYNRKERELYAKKNRQLFEVFQSMSNEYILGFLEFFVTFDLEHFTIDNYEDYIKSLPQVEFLSSFFYQIDKEIIALALTSEEELEKFYEQSEDLFSQYFAYRFCFQDTAKFIELFFKFVRSLQTPEAEKYLESKCIQIEQEKNHLISELLIKEPFEYTEELLAKTCYNRGPYETFYFMPSIFTPVRCCRLFDQDQFLFYDYIKIQETKINVPEQMKAMADNTRYRILLLLKEEKYMTGVEVSKKMHLATSTVSHHMNILREQGLIHEESTGSTKYYSLNTRAIQNCIKVLQDTFAE